ncbi:MAG: rod shape-determining protein MreC [bacterium]|nr:rod shape-determining protein MreC [bacterium]
MNRRVIAAGVVAGALALLVILVRTGLLGAAAQELAFDVSAPVLDAAGWPWRLMRAGWETLAGNRRLRAENAQLAARVGELEREVSVLRDELARVPQVGELASLQERYPGAILARVVLRDELSWSKTLVINRGERDGVMMNMAVVAGAGLVGKIIHTGYAYSRVLLLTDRSFRAGARLRRSRSTGLIRGRGTHELVLNYLPRDAAVLPGDEVVTSGLGGIFPSGYLIGRVREAIFEEYGFYQYAVVEPAVNVNTLEVVAVLQRQPLQIDVEEAPVE